MNKTFHKELDAAIKKNENLTLEIVNESYCITVYVSFENKWNFLKIIQGTKVLDQYLYLVKNKGNNMVFVFEY